jgi:hypothetical protein
LLTVDAKEDPTWPRKAKRFIDFWWYLDRHCTMSDEDRDDLSDVWERWAGYSAPRPDFVDTDSVYDQECDFISYGDSYPLAAHGCTYLYALVDNEIVVIKPEISVERLRVRYIGQTTSPSKRLRDHIHRPGSIERVKWIGGLLNNSKPLRMAVFDIVDRSRANILEKTAIYAFSECETRWDDELGDFPPLDAALLNIDK